MKECPADYLIPGEKCVYVKDCEAKYRKTGKLLLSIHHKFWPKAVYATPLEKEFRNLDENKTLECRGIHDTIHDEEEPPLKPSHDFMKNAVVRAYEKRMKERCDE